MSDGGADDGDPGRREIMTRVYDEAISTHPAPGARPMADVRGRARGDAGQSRGRLDPITTISILYVSLLLVWQALRFTPIGAWAPFEVVEIFGLALLVLLSMLCASRRSGLVLMLPILVLAVAYGPLFLLRTVPSIFRPNSVTVGSTLRVMAADLLVSNADPSAVAALILMERPDVVALQELSLVRIDYILHDRSLTARSARTGITPGSDHRHVLADLAFP